MSSDVAVELLALKRDAVVPFGVVGPDPTLERPGGGRRQEHHYAGGAGGPNTPKSKATPRTKLPSVHQLDAEGGEGPTVKRSKAANPSPMRRRPETERLRPDAGSSLSNADVGGGGGAYQRGGEEEGGGSFIPSDIWRHVKANTTPLSTMHGQSPTADRLFSGSGMHGSARRYNKGLRSLIGAAGRPAPAAPRSSSVPPSLTARMLNLDSFDHPIVRPEAPASRTEAVMLSEAFERMEANVRSQVGGRDATEVAKEAAMRGESHKVLNILEPELYLLDMVMGELVKQVRVGCNERGGLLDKCRSRVVGVFATSSLALENMAAFVEEQKKINMQLENTIAPLHVQSIEGNKRVAELESEVEALKGRIVDLEAALKESEKRREAKPKVEEQKVTVIKDDSEKENLMEQLREADEINGMLASKANILEGANKHMAAKIDVLQTQVTELEARVRRDAGVLESMGELAARYKVRVAWLRAIAFVRRIKKNTKETATQDGAGVDSNAEAIHQIHGFEAILGQSGMAAISGQDFGDRDHAGNVGEGAVDKQGRKVKVRKTKGLLDRGGTSAEGESSGGISREEAKHRVVKKEEIIGHVISYSAFWAAIIKQAEEVEFAENPSLQMSKKDLHSFISRVYQEKLIADEHDDRIGMLRQSLPEFLYDFHLEMLAEPQLAEQALVNIVANVRVYDRVSNRVRMFARFLNLGGQPFPVEALNIFLVSLVRLQNGQIPLLPDNDQVSTDAARALRVIEYVFGQAPFVIRSKILQEAEKKATGKMIDVDSLLLFIVEQWRDEAARSEERLRALFVASDADGDGNLDYDEFSEMIQHVNTHKGQRECLRMYAEMTLSRVVDCNTFVRSARKFRFFTFEVGPAVKKTDKFAVEMFDMITAEWSKVEDLVQELVVVLEGTRVGSRLGQRVWLLKKLMNEKIEAELAWLIYRFVVSEFASAIRNRLAKAQDT